MASAFCLTGAAPPDPSLNLTLKPVAAADGTLDGSIRLSAITADAGSILLRMAIVADSIPTTSYDSVTASDEAGPLPLKFQDGAPTSSGLFRDWKVGRATVGAITVHFTAKPRSVSIATRPGPFHDIRAEAGGLAGGGQGFLPLPLPDRDFAINLHWDLQGAPKGWLGTSSFGPGDVTLRGSSDRLDQAFYMAGPVSQIPNPSQGRFSLYWLSQPPFDPVALSRFIGTLYATESKFYGDNSSRFAVFLRRQPYLSGGGQGFYHSFALGYSGVEPQTTDYLHRILSHEMVHNWMDMQSPATPPEGSTDRAETGWYSEGGAEYYSPLLSYRAGLITLDELIEHFNARLLTYYASGLNTLSNRQADDISWKDRRAGKIPYVRGFLFLARTEAAIRSATGGRHGLDEVVQEMRRREVAGEPYGVEQWLDLVGGYLGRDARPALDDMASGHLLDGPTGAFAPCLQVVPREYHEFDVGFDQRQLDGGRTIEAVTTGSAAERTGLRAGDKIMRFTDPSTLMEDETAPMTIVVERDGVQRSFSYVPRGRPMPGFAWTRNARATARDCAL